MVKIVSSSPIKILKKEHKITLKENSGIKIVDRSTIQGPTGPQGIQGRDGLQGPQGVPGRDGADGRGISSIVLVSSSKYVSVYRITYTDGNIFDFEIKNGKDGKDGKDGADGKNGKDGKDGKSGGSVILSGVQKKSNMSNDYTDTDEGHYPSMKALHDALKSIKSIEFVVVEELPQTGESTKIYLVPSSESEDENIYDEYIWCLIEQPSTYGWEKIGSTKVDLTGYATETYVQNWHDTSKQDNINSTNKLSADLITNGTTNKVVTQTEKNTWNSKLSSITSSMVTNALGFTPYNATNPAGYLTIDTLPKYDGGSR